MWRKSVIVIGLCGGILPTHVYAGEPAALVMDYQGQERTDLSLFSELMDGTQISLGQTDTITLMHYRMCKTYAITGGRVAVSRRKLAVSSRKVKLLPSDGCPFEVAVVTSGVGGGALVRDVDYTTVPAHLNCVIIGKSRARVQKVAVEENGKIVANIPVKKGRLVPPHGFKLEEGQTAYALKFFDNKKIIKKLDVSPFQPRRPKTCLLRVE